MYMYNERDSRSLAATPMIDQGPEPDGPDGPDG